MPNRDDKSWLDALSDSPLNLGNYPGYAAGATQFAGNALSNIARSMSPVRFQEGEDAGFYPQVPPMITETAGAWSRLFGKQDNWHDGPGEVYPGDMNADAATMATAFYGGNALGGLRRGAVPRVAEVLSDNKPSLLGSAVATADQPQGFTAYHGSPHDFDKFSLDKIGTGEGAQAYGHGLYFAENEGVARSYRDALGRPAPTGADLGRDLAQYQVSAKRGDVDAAMADLQSEMAQYEKKGWPSPDYRKQYDDALNILKSGDIQAPGHMYQVRINADPNDFLDWDLPLSQQSEKVRNALSSIAQSKAEALAASDRLQASKAEAMGMKWNMRDVDPLSLTGSQIANHTGVRDAGIPGIRYLDGNSRADGAGSSNYVVFDDAMIEILKKYGMAGAVLGAGQLGLGLTGSEANASEYDPELEDILRRFGGQ